MTYGPQMETQVQDKLNDMALLATQLVTKHQVPHKHLLKVIREALLDHARPMPTLPILLNESYGGFGYNAKFEDFLETQAPSAMEEKVPEYMRHRVVEQATIEAFGKRCLEHYPHVAKLLRIYLAYKLDVVFLDITNIFYKRKKTDVDTTPLVEALQQSHGSLLTTEVFVTRVNANLDNKEVRAKSRAAISHAATSATASQMSGHTERTVNVVGENEASSSRRPY